MYQIVKMREEVKYSLRQSMWKKTKNVLDIVKTTGIITIPGFHYYKDIIHLIDIEDTIVWNNYQKKFKEIEKDDLVVIFENGNKERALLVRMKSDVRPKELEDVVIYTKEGFDNGYTQGKDVIQVSLNNLPPPTKFTTKKNMIALIREVEIVREVNSHEDLFKKYWKFQGHILRNRAEERFI